MLVGGDLPCHLKTSPHSLAPLKSLLSLMSPQGGVSYRHPTDSHVQRHLLCFSTQSAESSCSEDTVEQCTQDPVIGPYCPVCFPFLEPSTPPWNFQRGLT